RLLEALRQVPREVFVKAGMEEFAYDDAPLAIGAGQTISQPYIVALMIERLEIGTADTVLEVGTGSGYAAAVAGRLARDVFTIERHRVLADEAVERFCRLGFGNIHVRVGDGTMGWPEAAPFDGIMVAAGSLAIPEALKEQLV